MPQQSKWVNWQKPMKHVLFACVPLAAAAVYLFGWRVLAMLLLVTHRANLARLRAGTEPRYERARVLGRLWSRWRP